MSEKKYILVSMEDDRTKKIADVLGNKTCKKIIDFLAEKESSEKDIANSLNIPINTAEYNLKKLLDSELIEKTKNFFWSKKGKKIELYKLSNKSIIISPKGKITSHIKTILPVAIISGVVALIIRQLTLVPIKTKEVALQSTIEVAEAQAPAMDYFFFTQSISPGIWFGIGALFAIILFTIINLRKSKTERR